MPKCGHNFHLSCIDVWLRKQSTCPVCRLPLQESLGTKRGRSVMFSRTQSFDDSEVPREHSQQWLMPGHERSQANNTSNQSHVEESHPVDHSQPTTSGESETTQTRQWSANIGCSRTGNASWSVQWAMSHFLFVKGRWGRWGNDGCCYCLFLSDDWSLYIIYFFMFWGNGNQW